MSNLTGTSESILLCARDLIAVGGYNGFSYADIAAVVGIRKASIHHHFPSKAGLVVALIAQYREEARAGFAALDQRVANPLERLRAYVGYWETCITDATAAICICALLAGETPALPDEVVLEVRAHFHTLSAWLATVLAQAAEDGNLRLTGTAQAEAEIFMATIHGAMLSARAYGDPQNFGAVVRPLLERLAQ